VELGYVESVSHETVRQTLKKPAVVESVVIPPEANAEFVCRWKMYSMFIPVLMTLTRSFVSMSNKQLLGERLSHYQWNQESHSATITSMSATGVQSVHVL